MPILLCPVDDESDANVRVNPALVSTYFVRTFRPREDDQRSGSVVTASVVTPAREYKYRLTPRLSQRVADRALDDLACLLVSDISGIITWDMADGAWTVETGDT